MSTMSVSQMNAMAICCMQQGDYHRSIFVLKRALALLKSSLNNETSQVGTTGMAVAGTSPILASAVPAVLEVKTANEGNSFEVFARAFDLPEAMACAANKSRASLILLYNMGLSYHLCALATGCSCHLRMGRDLYKMALNVVENCLGDALTDSILLLQLLALFNNMGHIHSSYYEAFETKHCLDAIRALLDSKHIKLAKQVAGAELFLFFEWNNTLTKATPLFALAPAA